MNRVTIPTPMSTEDALKCVLVLAEWTPPEGLTVTVSVASFPGNRSQRVVNVVMSFTPEDLCVVNVQGPIDPNSLETLNEVGRLMVEAKNGDPPTYPQYVGRGQRKPNPTQAAGRHVRMTREQFAKMEEYLASLKTDQLRELHSLSKPIVQGGIDLRDVRDLVCAELAYRDLGVRRAGVEPSQEF